MEINTRVKVKQLHMTGCLFSILNKAQCTERKYILHSLQKMSLC